MAGKWVRKKYAKIRIEALQEDDIVVDYGNDNVIKFEDVVINILKIRDRARKEGWQRLTWEPDCDCYECGGSWEIEIFGERKETKLATRQRLARAKAVRNKKAEQESAKEARERKEYKRLKKLYGNKPV